MGNRARPYAVQVTVGAAVGEWQHYYTSQRGDSTYFWWRDTAGNRMILPKDVVPKEIDVKVESAERRRLWRQWRAMALAGQPTPSFSNFVKANKRDTPGGLAAKIAPERPKKEKIAKAAPADTSPGKK